MLLKLSGLCKRYGALEALSQLNVEVLGGCVGLLGPNGAGKSTLIRTLLGLLEPSSGAAEVLGFDIVQDCRKIRARVGYMPETETFFPAMTGLEMVSFAGELSGMPREDAVSRAHEMLDYTGVGESRYRLVETYSTGMKQRVKLAQAIVHGPQLVFLDEPTNGLDPMGREELLGIVSDLVQAGVHVVLSSHLLRDVERVCDSVLLMQSGRIVHYGPLDDFRAGDPGAVEVEVRGGCGFESFLQRLEEAGLQARPADGDERCVVATPAPEQLDALWRVAYDGGYELRELVPVRVSLEKAFLRFIEGIASADIAGAENARTKPVEEA